MAYLLSLATKDETVTNQTDRLRVVVATPLSEELCARIEELEPRVELIRDQALLPPMRWPGDHAGEPSFRRTDAEEEKFCRLVDSADALYGVPDETPVKLARTVGVNPGLRWVQTMPAGGGGQVRAAGLTAEQLDRVIFTTSAGVHAQPLAEYAVFGLLAGAKTLPRLIEQQEASVWSGRWAMSLISEQRILIVGLGSIGRATAVKLASLGAYVMGTSRQANAVEGVDEIVHPDRLTEAVASVDGIVVTLPGTAATEGLMSAEVFAAVKPGVTVVSVGRGTVIDESALIDALRDGRVGFAALDVFADEPLAIDSPLWQHPRVLVSPHTAALNPAEDRLIAELFARNATRLLDSRPLINRVDTVEFY